MSVKQTLQHIVLIVYLIISFTGLLFTLFRYATPFVPYRLMHFAYGMMAPYQGYITEDWELVAEGKVPGGEFEVISLEKYLPYQRGEKIMRGGLVTFRAIDHDLMIAQYTKLAAHLLELEKEKGYEQIRLSIHSWPSSPIGYEALRVKEFITIDPILTYP